VFQNKQEWNQSWDGGMEMQIASWLVYAVGVMLAADASSNDDDGNDDNDEQREQADGNMREGSKCVVVSTRQIARSYVRGTEHDDYQQQLSSPFIEDTQLLPVGAHVGCSWAERVWG
jgi:hypothetical protein